MPIDNGETRYVFNIDKLHFKLLVGIVCVIGGAAIALISFWIGRSLHEALKHQDTRQRLSNVEGQVEMLGQKIQHARD